MCVELNWKHELKIQQVMHLDWKSVIYQACSELVSIYQFSILTKLEKRINQNLKFS